VPDAAAIAFVNATSAAAPQFVRLTVEGSALRMTNAELVEPATLARAVVARQTIALVAGPDCARIATCGAPGCILFFLKDRRSAAWCSASCGNRARVARHYRRHRGD
jgi:predicted RNA-binding Zn ribbon-like protein